MYLYNVTIKVEHAIAADWLQWLKKEHIPEVLETGCFTKAQLLELIEAADEEGLTYAIQYHASSLEMYHRYLDNYAASLRQKGMEKWGSRFIAFRTLMKMVD